MKSPGTLETVKTVKAKEHQKDLEIPLTERLKSIPEVFGIRLNEEPVYDVLRTDGDFELRGYHAQLMAEVAIPGADFESFRELAFKKLAAYIFSNDIPMTAPVLQQRGEKNEWIMSFILPKNLTIENAPKPSDADVQLRAVNAYTAIATRYSGLQSESEIKTHEEKLATWLQSQNDLQSNGQFFSAQYDGPHAIPLLRRNEVLLKVNQVT